MALSEMRTKVWTGITLNTVMRHSHIVSCRTGGHTALPASLRALQACDRSTYTPDSRIIHSVSHSQTNVAGLPMAEQ